MLRSLSTELAIRGREIRLAVLSEGACSVRDPIFFGIFALRNNDFVGAFPTPSTSGLWQAKSMPEGGYLVQGIDEESKPVGNSYLVEESQFHIMFYPAAGPEEKTSLAALRADSPDLLAIWYAQALSEEHAELSDDGNANMTEGASAQAADDLAPAKDEARLTPVSHPDELLDLPEEESALISYLGAVTGLGNWPPAASSSAASAAPQRAWQQQPGAAPSAPHTTPPRLDDAAMESNMAALYEAEAQALEKSLRRRFNRLIQEMGSTPQPALEQEMARLLGKKYNVGWKQKYMFSDFGLALRRKHKNSLALLAHRRALSLAPDDENVMFNVARAEYEMGNVEGAKVCLNRVLQRSPDFLPARTFLQFLEGSL
jgi:tetratricopeptide (TPR) repeat protein